jgi:hypothetical protein
MQREIIDGIPFWSNKDGKLFYYNTAQGSDPKAIEIGTKTADGRLSLRADWLTVLAPILSAYRTSLNSRSRKPASTTASTSNATQR